MSSRKLVLVEYVDRVEASAGRADEDEKKSTIEAGAKRLVDAGSARSLVKRGVAKVVDAEADKPAKSVSAKASTKPADAGDN